MATPQAKQWAVLREYKNGLPDAIKTAHVSGKRQINEYKDARLQLEKLMKKTELTRKDLEHASECIQTLGNILNEHDARDMSIRGAQRAIDTIKRKLENVSHTEKGSIPEISPGGTWQGNKASVNPELLWLVLRISYFKRWLEENITIPDGFLEEKCPPALEETQTTLIFMKDEMERRFDRIRQTEFDKADLFKNLLEFVKEPWQPRQNEKMKGRQPIDPEDKVMDDMKQLLLNRHKDLLGIEEKLRRITGRKGASNNQSEHEEYVISRIENLVSELDDTKADKRKQNEDCITHISDELTAIQKQLDALDKEIQDNKYNDRAFKNLMTKAPSRSELIIEKVRDCAKEWSVENRQMKEQISNLKKTVTDRKLVKKRVIGDNQWQMDIRDIIEDIDKIVKELESSPYSKVNSEVKQLKREVNSKSVKESPKKNDNDEVLRDLGEIRGHLSQWSEENIQMQKHISNLKKCIKDKTLETIRIDGDNPWQIDINDIVDEIESIFKERKSQMLVHKELEEIKERISYLNSDAAIEPDISSDVSVDRQWERDLHEISKKMQEKEKLLQNLQGSIQLSDVLDGLRIIERKISGYCKTKGPKGQIRGRKGMARGTKCDKDIMMESVTRVVEWVDDIMRNLTVEMERLKADNRALVQEHDSMRDVIRTTKENVDKLGDEKQDLIIRLSNIAGAQLTIDNPNIADLSDPNRPTKLAERYREIYDNEWSDAYDVYEKERKMKEHEICSKLLDILVTAESECKAIADTHFKQLCCAFQSPVSNEVNGKLESDHLKILNDLRKRTAGLSVSSVQKQILKGKEATKKGDATILKYQMKCVEICWYMSLQTPPVILDKPLKVKGEMKFDREKYMEFYKRGELVEFVTWPPLLLHKDGPLLCKGVAQGK